MIKPKNEKVQDFLQEVSILNDEQFKILQKLREGVFSNYPETNERIMYGGILFSLEDDFGGLFAYKNHVSFEFSMGFKMDDPEMILEGKGKYRRHLKIRTLPDIEAKKVDFFVKQAV